MTVNHFIVIAIISHFTPICIYAEPNRSEFQKSILVDHCDKLYSLACFKLDAANWLDRFGVNSEFNIIPGVSMMQNPNSVKVYTSDIAKEVAREFPDDEGTRVNQFLQRKIKTFLENHSLKLSLWNALEEESTNVTGRKEKDKKGDGGMGMILVAGALMVGVLTALAMGGLTALAGKALLTGLVSFVLSAIIGLKQLTSPKEKTYIARPVPIYTSPTSGHEGWEEYAAHSRSAQDADIPKGLQAGYSPS